MTDKLLKYIIYLSAVCIVITGLTAAYVSIEIHPVALKEHQHQKHIQFIEQMVSMIKSEEKINSDALIAYLEADIEHRNSEYELYQSLHEINSTAIELIIVCIFIIIVLRLLLSHSQRKNLTSNSSGR